MFGKKKQPKIIDDSDVVKASIPIFFGDQQIGEVARIITKEVGGLAHLEFWLHLTFGSGIIPQIRDVLIKQGLYIGRPPNDT